MTGSALYVGRVTHRRFRGPAHSLDYRVFMLLLDLDGLDRLFGRLRLLSRGRFGLMSFREADHGDGSAVPLAEQARARLRAAGIAADGPVRLLCMPRVLGYGFNPLSIYFCHAADGALAAVLYEVSNTFGERHSYLVPVDAAEGEPVRQAAPKRLHVSPFMEMRLDYDFRLAVPSERLQVTVSARDADGPALAAAFTAVRRPLDDRALLAAFASHPLLTLKVIAGIHWEALRLLLKGARYHRRPPPPAEAVTLGAPGRSAARG